MEVNVKKLEMDKLNSYIRIFDNVLPENTLKIFRKICEDHVDYEEASVVNNKGKNSIVKSFIKFI